MLNGKMQDRYPRGSLNRPPMYEPPPDEPPKPPKPSKPPVIPTDGYFASSRYSPTRHAFSGNSPIDSIVERIESSYDPDKIQKISTESSVGEKYKSSYNPGNIQEMWDKKTSADISALDANTKAEKELLDSQRSKATNEYRGLRNQATASHAMQEKARKEYMANIGASAGGGTSRTHQQRATNNLNNQLGSINLQERQFGEEVDRALREVQGRYSAEVNSILANNNLQSTTQQIQSDQWKAGHDLAAAQHNSGLEQWKAGHDLAKAQYNSGLEQWKAGHELAAAQYNSGLKQWKAGHDLATEQHNSSLDQWDKQFGWNKENAKIAHLIDLLKAKKISKKQFEAISGMKL